MSKISNMNMVEILNKINVDFNLGDIYKICSNKEVGDRVYELIADGKDFYEVLIDNEEYIDNEKLLMVIWLCNKEKIKEKENEILNSSLLKIPLNRTKIEQEIRDLKSNMQKIRKLSRDMDTYLTIVHNEKGLSKDITVISSREEILGFDLSEKEKHNRKKFDYIDKNLVEKNDEDGMKYAIQSVEIGDLAKVLPFDIAKAAEYKITNNSMVCGKEYIDKYKEKESKGKENDEEISNLDDEYKINILLPEMRDTIKQVLKYVDLEKLLLIEIYRLEREFDYVRLTNKTFPNEKLKAAKTVTTFLSNLIGKDIILENEDSIYTYNDAQNFIDRINAEKNIYITSEEAKTLKAQLLDGLNLEEASEETIIKAEMLSYTKDEFDTIMAGTKSGFEFGIIMQELSEEQIIEKAYQHKDKWSNALTKFFYSEGLLTIKSIIKLYSDGILNAEFLKEFSSENNISEELNLQKIHEKYLTFKNQKEPKQEEAEQLERLTELYKLINIQEKTPEELEEISNSVMYEIAENFEDEEDIIFYYENGLVTLETVADWSGENVIEELYNNSKITFEDLEFLYKSNKISKELIQRKISLDNMDYTTLITQIMSGYVSEKKIIDLYMEGKLFDTDFEKIALEGKIGIDQYYVATSKRTKEILEENARIKFKPILYNIPDKKIKMNVIDNTNTNTNYSKNNKNKTLIDPNIRYEFLKLLGAKEAEAVILDEDNAFYNYEFFVIPDSQGNLQENSVVIAERFFEDKEIEDKFATDNATYFFQYKDLMVNSNLSKKDMVQNRDNVVFTANHRVGSWAVSVLYKLAETMSGDDFKKYKKGDERAGRVIDELHKIYSSEEIRKILDLAGRIDDTNEYIYEEINSGFGKSDKNDGEER